MPEQVEQEQNKPAFPLFPKETFQQFQDQTTPEAELRITREFIQDHEIPEHLKARYFALVDKQAVIGNLDPKDIERHDNKVDLIETLGHMGTPRWEIKFDDLLGMEQLKLKTFKAVRRSRSGFERQMLVTQRAEQKANVVSLTQEGKRRRKWRFF